MVEVEEEEEVENDEEALLKMERSLRKILQQKQRKLL